MSDLTKILAKNQKELLKLIAPLIKKQPGLLNIQDSDSDPAKISVARTSMPVKTPVVKNFMLYTKYCKYRDANLY